MPEPAGVTYLQFRRYAGCPICNLHLRSFRDRLDEIGAAGVHEVVVFHSTAAALATYQADLPFHAVPDPTRALYREFGVEWSVRALLHPGSWLAAIRGWSPSLPLRSDTGGHFGLPADFLITPDGRVLAPDTAPWPTTTGPSASIRPRGGLLREALQLLPDLLRLQRRLAADPALPRDVRIRLGLLMAYLVPIDLIPDFVSVIGSADDAIIVTAVLRSVVRRAGLDVVRARWPGTADGFTALIRLTGLTRAD